MREDGESKDWERILILGEGVLGGGMVVRAAMVFKGTVVLPLV